MFVIILLVTFLLTAITLMVLRNRVKEKLYYQRNFDLFNKNTDQ